MTSARGRSPTSTTCPLHGTFFVQATASWGCLRLFSSALCYVDFLRVSLGSLSLAGKKYGGERFVTCDLLFVNNGMDILCWRTVSLALSNHMSGSLLAVTCPTVCSTTGSVAWTLFHLWDVIYRRITVLRH